MIIIQPTHSKVYQICMKFNEKRVKLNLNESLVESKVFVFQRKDSSYFFFLHNPLCKEKHLSHWCHTKLEETNELIYSLRKSVTENFAIW